MKPILFSKTATSFNTNGLGRLDAISCEVTEERNGLFELEMEIAETANHAKEIEMCSIIVAKPSQSGKNQPFRVYKIGKPINGRFKVYAQHISYQLSYIPVMPFTITASASACSQTLAALKSNSVGTNPFSFQTDVNVVASYQQTAPASLRSRLGGVEGSVLDQFGGEYEWDNYTVKLLKNRGLVTPNVSLRYGKNITDLTQEENIENTITGIVPYWQSSEGETTVTLPEKVIESSTASNFPFKRTVPMDFSQSFQDEPTVAQLRAKAQAYVNQSGVGIPKVSIKLSFVSLADTEEYKSVAALQAVNLCDNINVYFEKLGISTTAKIVKTVYDVLLEKYDSLEIGSLKSTLASTISGQDSALSTLANNTQRMFKQYNNTVNEMIDTATAWLTKGDGYVVAVKNTDGSWKELLFMDTADMETAHNVLRVNQNGIGFSSTGVAGPYTQAWTLDGRMVIGGTNVPSLTVYDNQQNILFRIDKNGLQWDAPNSSMTTAGVLKMEGGSIDAGTVTGATIRTDDEGSRIVLDSSSSIKGYYDDTLHNIIIHRLQLLAFQSHMQSERFRFVWLTDKAILPNHMLQNISRPHHRVHILPQYGQHHPTPSPLSCLYSFLCHHQNPPQPKAVYPAFAIFPLLPANIVSPYILLQTQKTEAFSVFHLPLSIPVPVPCLDSSIERHDTLDVALLPSDT